MENEGNDLSDLNNIKKVEVSSLVKDNG